VTPEGQIKKAIMDYLAARYVFAVRMNSGMQFGEHKGKKWAVHLNAPGTADILAFPLDNIVLFRGVPVYESIIARIRPLWIEVKAPKGKQSKLQKSFQAQVEREGHRYIVARGIGDVEEVLR
jgi:hypothetical protein